MSFQCLGMEPHQVKTQAKWFIQKLLFAYIYMCASYSERNWGSSHCTSNFPSSIFFSYFFTPMLLVSVSSRDGFYFLNPFLFSNLGSGDTAGQTYCHLLCSMMHFTGSGWYKSKIDVTIIFVLQHRLPNIPGGRASTKSQLYSQHLLGILLHVFCYRYSLVICEDLFGKRTNIS